MTDYDSVPVTSPKVVNAKPILSIRNLEVEYVTARGVVKAVNGVSFDIAPNEVLGLAGESGCGKSTIAHAITRMLHPPAYITGGQVLFQNMDLLLMDQARLNDFRWQHMSIVFQSAMNSLNPVLTIGAQIMDAIQTHLLVNKKVAVERAKELLQTVGIDPKRIDSYPHQLSGGMRQRTAIAIALALNPELIIMDEPTTALDVVVQKQIIEEIQQLKEAFGFSILFITHDLSLLVEFADRICIMYAGKQVEIAPSREIFTNPKHPYTERLMDSFPMISGPRREMVGIPGSPPDLISPPSGCRFHPRCDVAIAGRCQEIEPQLQKVSESHLAACHLLDEKVNS